MQAGRELDALIAERVFGLKVDWELEEPRAAALRDRYDEDGILPWYSTDIGDAWKVVEAMRGRGFRFAIIDQPGTGIKSAQFFNGAKFGAMVGERSEMHAICNAALQALQAVGV